MYFSKRCTVFVSDHDFAAHSEACDFILFSDQRWEVAKKRALPWRMIPKRRVLFIEPPACSPLESEARLRVFSLPAENVHVMCMVYPGWMRRSPHETVGFNHEIAQPEYSRLLNAYLEAEHYRQPIVWMNSAAAVPFLASIDYRLLVYDLPDHPAVERMSIEVIQPNAVVLR